MKAPDVIYVEFSEDVNLAFEEQPFEETPVYIRKEALVEFVNKKLQESADRLDFRTNRAYAELIDHINEM